MLPFNFCANFKKARGDSICKFHSNDLFMGDRDHECFQFTFKSCCSWGASDDLWAVSLCLVLTLGTTNRPAPNDLRELVGSYSVSI